MSGFSRIIVVSAFTLVAQTSVRADPAVDVPADLAAASLGPSSRRVRLETLARGYLSDLRRADIVFKFLISRLQKILICI